MTVPFIVSAAPNGARLTKSDHEALPITATELAETAVGCLDAGASLLHMHVRDCNGRHSLDADLYREAILAVRAAVGDRLIIQVSTESAGVFGRETQMALVQTLRPESVSLAVSELIPDEASERDAAAFLAWLHDEKILVQWIVYADADVMRLRDLLQRGVVRDARPSILFVVGRRSSVGTVSMPDARQLVPLLNAWQGMEGTWTVCGFGLAEHACAVAATALGGHARVGFENNLHLADGTLAANNAVLVRKAAEAADFVGRRLADAGMARELLAAI